MSEAVSALKAAEFTGGIAEVTLMDPIGMISVRGDLGAGYMKKALKKAVGLGLPDTRSVQINGDRGVAWMSPDELLLLCPYDQVSDTIDMLTKCFGSNHTLAVNVSDARAVFRISGAHSRDVLAKLAPVDLSPDSFTPGMIRRTRLAQVPAAFWIEDGDSFRLVCFRSVAQYVFDLLKTAAQPGSAPEYYSAAR
ncbi:sarcosine oxidase subunit gamma family protein [Sulfitobacter pontiacus]|jgi:sarcosine oxidase subunit gamma|uniref:sarcosine oxidase subunit gamma n=1 Tax=Sulfitobacter pontiacus TaxID=60137 RepID=UPI002AC97163|nr:sarcosine oxidase subunit gamma family protein [Sulfitobacter pontiacus]WPZ23989.1 sarcosine oxidase subunit gamma family protein [Sulfitobacter pontiacus]